MAYLHDKASEAIARAEAHPERDAIFVELSAERILDEATRIEDRHDAGEPLPLYGYLVSLKDLVDEVGQRTTAGSRLLADRAPATRDAEIVRRLRAAGALPFGRTSLSEFAYSGVGLNPHHGTPGNVFDPARVPGGSSSGAALSVAHGFCDAGIGTDTGGSVRVPAAVNGLVGFKPTRTAVPLEGIHPLSASHDSVGPIAAELGTVLRVHEVLAGLAPGDLLDAPLPERPLRLALPVGAFTDELEPAIRAAFDEEKARIVAAGHALEALDLAFLTEALPTTRLLVGSEALALYRDELDALADVGDPNVYRRIRAAEAFGAEELRRARARREELIDAFAQALAGFDALVAPTVAIETPTIARAEREFDAVNPAMLRNTAMINLADGCAMTLPVGRAHGPPGALMIAGPRGADTAVVAAARVLEAPTLARGGEE